VSNVEDLIERIVGWLERLAQRRSGRLSPRTERIALALSVAIFIGAAYVAFRALPDVDLRWVPLLIAGIGGVPATVILNAMEYQASGRILDHRIRFVTAVKVTVVGSAANLLPIPGSVIVRVKALSGMGSTYLSAVSASAAVGGIFVGITVFIAGLAQFFVELYVLAVAWTAAGMAIMAVGYALLRRGTGPGRAPRLALRVAIIEAVLVLLGGVRLFLILLGLGFEPHYAQAVGLIVAGAIATAIGFFPAGLGIRELLVAAVSPLVGISAAAGLAAAVVDRLFRFSIMGVIAGTLAFRLRGGAGFGTSSPSPHEPDSEVSRGSERG
jgi:uncharacterized membrane protein YbhN (UPF0104 family)